MNYKFLIVFLTFTLCGFSNCRQSHEVEYISQSNSNLNLQTSNAIAKSSNSAINLNNEKRIIIKGGELCEKYVLREISNEKAEDNQILNLKTKEAKPTGIGRSALNNPIVKLDVFKTDNKQLSENLEKWLVDRDIDDLVAFELRHKEKIALILGSKNIRASGLAANFENWHVRFKNNSIEFLSLSENPDFIFWDKNGLLNYYVTTYGDNFIENKDWDNLTLNILRFRVDKEGTFKLLNQEVNVKCE